MLPSDETSWVRLMRTFIGHIVFACVLAISFTAQASPVVNLGHYYVSNHSSTSVNLPVADSGNAAAEDIEGMTFTLQITGGTGNLPAISSVNFLTGTIWSGQVSADDVIQALDGNLPQFQSYAVITDAQGEFVNANGTLATVSLNANGAPLGNYTLELTANQSSDSKFTDGVQNTVPASFTSGTLTVLAPGDFNRDNHVDASDLLPMMQALSNLSGYETAHGNLPDAAVNLLGDINGDGQFNNADVQAMLNLLKSGGGSTAAVPEPNSLALLFLGLLAFIAATYALPNLKCISCKSKLGWRSR
jgi:hypothetical protein